MPVALFGLQLQQVTLLFLLALDVVLEAQHALGQLLVDCLEVTCCWRLLLLRSHIHALEGQLR